MTAKPNMNNAWAEAGSIATPSTTVIQIGWEDGDIPPAEVQNFVDNRQDNAIKHVLEEGISLWDNTTSYPVNGLVKRNGDVYKAILTNSNKDPVTEPTYWNKAFDEFGSAQEVQDIVDEITGTDGYVEFYVQKSDPTLENPLSAPKVSADTGPSNGFKFQSDTDANAATSGVVYNSGNVEIVVANSVKARFTTSMSVNTNDETVVTTAMLRAFILDFAFPVGCLHITEESYSPNIKFGGSWIRVAKGQAIVGRHDGVTGDIPDWVKTAGNTFGEYEHTLTTDELPNFRLGQNAYSDALAPTADPIPHVNPFQAGSAATGLGQTTDAAVYTDKLQVYTDPIGNDEPFSIVQPSVVYNIWKRIG